jgi:hypothetical protein
MKKSVRCIVFLLLASSTLRATWASIPLKELVEDSDLIVIGTLHSANEDGDGIGQGYVSVEQIISRDLGDSYLTTAGRRLAIGDNLRIKWADNWACAAGMHMSRVGKKGIWLLKVDGEGAAQAGYPGRFRPVSDSNQIDRLVTKSAIKRPALLNVNTGETDEEPSLSTFIEQAPNSDLAVLRAAATLLISIGLYFLLYKSRYGIR